MYHSVDGYCNPRRTRATVLNVWEPHGTARYPCTILYETIRIAYQLLLLQPELSVTDGISRPSREPFETLLTQLRNATVLADGISFDGIMVVKGSYVPDASYPHVLTS